MANFVCNITIYCRHGTGAEFAAELRSLRERVARQDWSALGPLVGIFAPTAVWDDGFGRPSARLPTNDARPRRGASWANVGGLGGASRPVPRRLCCRRGYRRLQRSQPRGVGPAHAFQVLRRQLCLHRRLQLAANAL